MIIDPLARDDDLDEIAAIADPHRRAVAAADRLARYESLADRARAVRNQSVVDMLMAGWKPTEAADAINRSRAYISAKFPRPPQPEDHPEGTGDA